MMEEKTGLILIVLGILIALGSLVGGAALLYNNPELHSKIYLFNGMEWVIFFIGIIIAGAGEYIRR